MSIVLIFFSFKEPSSFQFWSPTKKHRSHFLDNMIRSVSFSLFINNIICLAYQKAMNKTKILSSCLLSQMPLFMAFIIKGEQLAQIPKIKLSTFHKQKNGWLHFISSPFCFISSYFHFVAEGCSCQQRGKASFAS